MARPRKLIPKAPLLPAPPAPKLLGQSCLYQIKKYGLYAYQVLKIDPETGSETKVSVENIYGVVASDLVDLMFRDINPEHK